MAEHTEKITNFRFSPELFPKIEFRIKNGIPTTNKTPPTIKSSNIIKSKLLNDDLKDESVDHTLSTIKLINSQKEIRILVSLLLAVEDLLKKGRYITREMREAIKI